MAIELRTTDEETADLVNTFDAVIAPSSVARVNTNKLFLVLKSIAAGYVKIRDVVLALKYRFDPRFADPDDLESAMFITGERRIGGKASIARVVITNSDIEETVTLSRGTYQYVSLTGQPFYYYATDDVVLGPGEFTVGLFTSRDVGMFELTGEQFANVVRVDGERISTFIDWEVLENSNSLGRLPETDFEIRQRLLTDTTRQDTLRELELAINALPSIFSCNLLFNQSSDDVAVLEDGTELQPKTLLIVLTGVPNKDFAETVMSRTVYTTHMNTQEEVVNYRNDIFVGGLTPVFFMFHKRKEFYLTIHYRFDNQLIQRAQVENRIDRILRKYKIMTQHLPEINEPLIYRDLEDHDIPSVVVRKVYIQELVDGALESVAEVEIPRLMLPQLAGITYIGDNIDTWQTT